MGSCLATRLFLLVVMPAGKTGMPYVTC